MKNASCIFLFVFFLNCYFNKVLSLPDNVYESITLKLTLIATNKQIYKEYKKNKFLYNSLNYNEINSTF